MRWIAALLLTTTFAASLSMPVARADRPKDQQGGDAGPPPAPAPDPSPPPTATVTPAPAPAAAPTIVVAPTVAATGTVIVGQPPAGPAPAGGAGSPVVITPQGVPIVIRNHAEDAASIEHRLVTIDGTVLGVCTGNCTFQVPPGTYVLESGETDELRSGRQQIVATGPTMVDVRPGSKSTRRTGLVLGITGPVLFMVGFFGTFIVFAQRNSSLDCDTSGGATCSSADQPSYVPWVLSLVAGVAGTTAGWIMFGTSGTKMKTSGYAPSVASIALAPVITPTTTGAAFTVRF